MELIFELASECESLFSEQISRLKNESDLNGAKVVGEYQQRFAAWAAFLGVFAVPEMCLDRRLRRHVEIQDLVLRLLDIMKRNLTHLFETDDASTSDGQDLEMPDPDQVSPPQMHISVESLRGIRGAIDRLNHLGGTIQRSSEAGQATKFGKFATSFDSAPFEEIARLAINSFYPDASPSLLEQLIRVVTDMYERFHYRRSRQVRLQARSRALLSTIDEESVSNAKGNIRMVPPPQTHPPIIDMNKLLPRPMSMTHIENKSHKSKDSKPTSLDSREFNKFFSQQNGGSVKSKTKSILVSQVAYPRPSEESLVCEWCFLPLPEDKFKGEEWKKHLNEDFQPFACISEKCSEPVKRFATSRAWFNHMLETHGQNWHREIHLPVWWICPLCNSKDTTYSRAHDLSEHISKLHDDIFTRSQIQVIVHQSQLRSPRSQDTCPLCCLSMRDGQENNEEEQVVKTNLPNFSHKDQEPGESHKRVKTETGPKKQTQHSDVNFGAEMEQAAPTAQIQSSQSQQQLLKIEAIARHVAAHLQGIMLFTLRMMSLNVVPDISTDDKILSSDTDHDSSRVGSNQQHSEKEAEVINDRLEQQDDNIDLNSPPLDDTIPDCEHLIDWQDVIHNNERLSETDTFLQEMIRTGAFHYKESTEPPELLATTRASIRPPRNPYFIDRAEIFSRIVKQCSEPASCVALVGLGGIGKSQLAIELAYQTAAESAEVWVFWIDADTQEHIEEGFRTIADTVKLPGRTLPSDDLFQLVFDWLSDVRNGRWIIIFDGVNDQLALHKMSTPMMQPLIHRYLPPQRRNSSIIITTRNKDLGYRLTGNHRNVIEIGPMPIVDAIRLFRKKLGSRFNSDSDMNAAIGLVKALGLIPLAITQALVYIEHQSVQIPLNKFLEKLEESEEKKIELLEFDAGGIRQNGDVPNTILATWQSSFDYIRSQRPSAADLLSLMSFFDRRGIPKWLLTSYKQDNDTQRANSPSIMGRLELDSSDSDTNSDADNTFNDDIEMLTNYSLIVANRSRDIFEMHGLVQLSVKKSLVASRRQALNQQFIQRLAAEFPARIWSNWSICQELFAHVEEAAKCYPSNNALESWATLLHNGGRYARLLGEYEIAMQMADKASIARVRIREEDMKFLENLSLVALILMDQGLYSKADGLFTHIANACKTMGLAADHCNTLTSMNNLASIYRVQGRWKEAEKLQVEVAETRKTKLAEDHPSTLSSAANLASIYRAQGRYTEAEMLQMRVMERCKKELGQGNPQTLTSMSNLASIYRIQGKLEEAEKLQIQAMNVREIKFGRNHPDTLSSMNSLASIFRAQGRLGDAENLQVDVMELRIMMLGKDHPNTLASMNNLALIYNDQGECERAMKLQSQVVEISKRKLGPNHPHTLTGLNNLAFIWKSHGQDNVYITLMKDCSEARERVLGPEHPYTLSSLAAVEQWSK